MSGRETVREYIGLLGQLGAETTEGCITVFQLNRRWIVLSSLALLLMGGRFFQRSDFFTNDTLSPKLEPLPQDPYLQVYFNQSEAAVYTDGYRQVARYGDDLEQVIIATIDQATKTVDVAVQAFNLPNVADALVRSKARGVRVRLILEDQYAEVEDAHVEGLTDTANSPFRNALEILDRGNIARIDDTADGSKGSGLMHHKFVVVDGRWVIASSANFTLSGIHGDVEVPESRGNANAVVKIEDAAIAQAFTTEFEYMWGDGPGRKPDSKFGLQKVYRGVSSFDLPGATRSAVLQFSPTSATQPLRSSVNGLIANTLSQSTQSIDAALFVFSDQAISNQIEQRVNTGVAFRALVDPGFIYRSYSEALDALGVEMPDQRCKIEENNRPWQNPSTAVGFPWLAAGDKLHHKFAVIDDDTVVFGSQNWSVAANTKNDETLMVIENPIVAAHFNREFERLYREKTLGKSQLLQQKIAIAYENCH